MSVGEDRGQGILLHQDLAHANVLGGQDVSAHLLIVLHSQLDADKPVFLAGKQKRGWGNTFNYRLLGECRNVLCNIFPELLCDLENSTNFTISC